MTAATDYNAQALAQLRKRFDLTQSEFAQWMGVPFRTYQDLEGGKSPIRPVHIRAAQMAAILIANEMNNTDLLPDDLKKLDLIKPISPKGSPARIMPLLPPMGMKLG